MEYPLPRKQCDEARPASSGWQAASYVDRLLRGRETGRSGVVRAAFRLAEACPHRIAVLCRRSCHTLPTPLVLDAVKRTSACDEAQSLGNALLSMELRGLRRVENSPC